MRPSGHFETHRDLETYAMQGGDSLHVGRKPIDKTLACQSSLSDNVQQE